MSIRIRMTELLRQYTSSRGIVEVNGNTVGECLDDLIRQYSGAKKQLFDRNGVLLVLIRVNNEETAIHHREGLSRPVTDGDELYLYLVLGGG